MRVRLTGSIRQRWTHESVLRLILGILTEDLILLRSIGILDVRLLAVHWTVLQSAIASLVMRLMRQVVRRYVVCNVCHD